MNKNSNIRSICAIVLSKVIDEKKSLSYILPKLNKHLSSKDKALLQEISFGIVRVLPILERLIKQMISNPLKGKKKLFTI